MVSLALELATPDDPPANQRTVLGGDDRILPFATVSVAVNDDPIVRHAQLVSPCRVGEQGGVVPRTAMRVEDGQPLRPAWVEAPGGDLGERAVVRSLVVLAVDAQQFADGWVVRAGGFDDAAEASEPDGKGIANAAQALRSDPTDACESTIVCRNLEFLQRPDPEIVMEALGEPRPDTGHRTQEGDGIARSSQSIQKREAPRQDDVTDTPRKVGSNGGERFQTLEATAAQDLIHRNNEATERGGRVAVGLNPERIRVLVLQERRHLIELGGNVAVE